MIKTAVKGMGIDGSGESVRGTKNSGSEASAMGTKMQAEGSETGNGWEDSRAVRTARTSVENRARVEGITDCESDLEGGCLRTGSAEPQTETNATVAAVTTASLRRDKGLKFYDLGSGSGKAVFAAVLAVDFR